MLKQQELIAKVKAMAENDEAVAAVLMYGSFTQNAGDKFSDVEFYVFVRDEAFDAFNAPGWITGIASVLVHFINNYGTLVAVFDSLIRGEFHFLPQSQMPIIESFAPIGYVPNIEAMHLYDATGSLRGYLQKLQKAAAAVDRNDEVSIEDNIYNCLNLLLMGVNVLQRGEKARAWETLSQALPFYVRLLRLCENQTHHWLNPMKNLEHELSAAAYQSLAACMPGLHAHNLAKAYANLTENLIATSEKLKQNHSFNFNAQAIEKIKNYIVNAANVINAG